MLAVFFDKERTVAMATDRETGLKALCKQIAPGSVDVQYSVDGKDTTSVNMVADLAECSLDTFSGILIFGAPMDSDDQIPKEDVETVRAVCSNVATVDTPTARRITVQ
jgi:hypothetical protein